MPTSLEEFDHRERFVFGLRHCCCTHSGQALAKSSFHLVMLLQMEATSRESLFVSTAVFISSHGAKDRHHSALAFATRLAMSTFPSSQPEAPRTVPSHFTQTACWSHAGCHEHFVCRLARGPRSQGCVCSVMRDLRIKYFRNLYEKLPKQLKRRDLELLFRGQDCRRSPKGMKSRRNVSRPPLRTLSSRNVA